MTDNTEKENTSQYPASCYEWVDGRWTLKPEYAAAHAAHAEKVEAARLASAANPFDARSEISADARLIAESSRRIVKHLWIIFVLLPVVLGILFAILTAK